MQTKQPANGMVAWLTGQRDYLQTELHKQYDPAPNGATEDFSTVELASTEIKRLLQGLTALANTIKQFRGSNKASLDALGYILFEHGAREHDRPEGTKLNGATRWQFMLPYGIWRCADGQEVLFNRGYMPILRRYPDQPVTAANPGEWVAWNTQEYFWDDATTRKSKMASINNMLQQWELPLFVGLPPHGVAVSLCSLREQAARGEITNPWLLTLATNSTNRSTGKKENRT